jgi:hypothetical protein
VVKANSQQAVRITGYYHSLYPQSLEAFGDPLELRFCKGYVLKRPIAGFPYYDAMGCYPLFVCQDWTQLHAGLEDLEGNVVSLSLVTDPFGDYDEQMLRLCFPDVVMPFKEHFVRDMSCSLEASVSEHHRRYARKALRQIHVERCEDPVACADEWGRLYQELIERHAIGGIAAFSTDVFEKQLRVPGIVVFRALFQKKILGMLLWYVQGDIAYYHLGAYSTLGYDMRASFALFWKAIEYFATSGVGWLNLGAGAGIHHKEHDGLSRFKKGWSTGTKKAYFCGRIFDHAHYREITESKGIRNTDYFPAYREGEFL